MDVNVECLFLKVESFVTVKNESRIVILGWTFRKLIEVLHGEID